MTRMLASLRHWPVVAAGLLGLAAGGSGWAVAATAGSPVIRACANKRTGALRLARRCRHNERRVTWNQVGPQGPAGPRGRTGLTGRTGAAGAPGATGAIGAQGAPGPGASSFAAGASAGSGEVVLTRLTNGVTVSGICEAATVSLTIKGVVALVMSGTSAEGAASLKVADQNGPGANKIANESSVDYDAIAFGNVGVLPPSPLPAGWGGNARIDVHGERSGTACSFRGMAIPSS